MSEPEVNGSSRSSSAAFFAHDLRNLLSAVVGHADVQLSRLQNGAQQDPELARSLEAIRLNAQTAEAVCREMLELLSGRLQHREHVDLGRLVQEALGLFLARIQHCVCCRAGGPPGIVICGIGLALERAILNLLWNAHDAVLARWGADTDSASIRVRWGRGPSGPWLEVADNGPGLPPDWVAKLGKSLELGSGSGKGADHGLGLQEVALTARLHGGRLRGFNDPEEGGAVLRLEFGLQPEFEFEAGRG